MATTAKINQKNTIGSGKSIPAKTVFCRPLRDSKPAFFPFSKTWNTNKYCEREK